MVQAPPRASSFMSMSEYLTYEDGTDTRYTLTNGELTIVPAERHGNLKIAKYLMFELSKLVPLPLIELSVEVAVPGLRATTRIPDLILHSDESLAALDDGARAVILLEMPPPALVVEVVSPGQENRDRDYRYKRTEYAARHILEYWIIDPEAQKITICLWVNGQYEDTVYDGDTPLQSTVVPKFGLSTDQILAFGYGQ